MSTPDDFSSIALRLREILEPYAAQLVVTTDGPAGFSLNTRHMLPNRQPLFFASYQIQKNYVSFYLMPVYACPELLTEITPALRKRMQGKSCFNFKHIDEGLLEELKQLTRAGFERFQTKGYIPFEA